MTSYADTSFLVSLYAPDTHSVRAIATANALSHPLFFTGWQEFEWTNAILLRRFRGEITDDEVERCRAKLETDFESGLFVRAAPVFADVLARAKQLSRSNTARIGCRAFDVFHVASALELSAKRFLTFDERQRMLAAAAG